MLRELADLQQSVGAHAWVLHNIVPVISLGVYRLALSLGVPIIQVLHSCRPVSLSGTLSAHGRALRPDDPWRNVKEVLAGTWHGRLASAWLGLAYAAARARGDFAAVKAALAISNSSREVFQRGGWFTDRLHTLRHCWHIAPRPAQVSDKGYLLYLGRMVPSKGPGFLTELWRDPAVAGTPLIMAGEGPELDALKRHSPRAVTWTGYVTGQAKRDLIASARAVLLPSLAHEALGLTVYEAYECAKPVLASAIGGMSEIVFDRRTGRLLPVGDKVAWREALLGLDAATARTMGAAARDWLEQNTSPDDWNRQFDAIAAQVLGPA